jgi:hypothetical protein
VLRFRFFCKHPDPAVKDRIRFLLRIQILGYNINNNIDTLWGFDYFFGFLSINKLFSCGKKDSALVKKAKIQNKAI